MAKEPLWHDSDGVKYTLDELRSIWVEDCANVRSYRAQGNEGDLSDEDFERRYSFESWLEGNGTYYPVDDDDDDDVDHDGCEIANGDDEARVSRDDAEFENGRLVMLYSLCDSRILTWDDLADEAKSEAANLPNETWSGGRFNVNDYITESCHAGIYKLVEAVAEVVTQYVYRGRRWTAEQINDEIYSQFKPVRPPSGFDIFLKRMVDLGGYQQVDVLQYKDAENDQVVAERIIVD
jgi:hypothetical protein